MHDGFGNRRSWGSTKYPDQILTKQIIQKMKTSKKSKKSAKLANPVTSLANKIATAFAGDSSITAKFYFNKSTLRVICEKSETAIALAAISKSHFDLGNLYLDAKGRKKQVKDVPKLTQPKAFAKAFEAAFGKCKTYSEVIDITDPFGSTWYYLLGSTFVCQYDNDDTRSPWGITSCLPEDVFVEMLDVPNGVKISTGYVDPNRQ